MDSWSKSWRNSPWAGTIPNNLFHDVQRSTVEGLVGRGAKLHVLSLDDRPEVILGWACTEVERTGRTVVHMLYVKDPYQAAMPNAPQLLLDAVPGEKPGFYTHRTKKVQAALGRGRVWAPEIARRK
jgi:hypothetical protein